VIEERIEVPYMIGKPILDVGFSRLAEPDEIRCDAMGHRRNQRKDIPPYVRRDRVPVQKKRDRCFAISRFPVDIVAPRTFIWGNATSEGTVISAP
jgi:hypothetical protein